MQEGPTKAKEVIVACVRYAARSQLIQRITDASPANIIGSHELSVVNIARN